MSRPGRRVSSFNKAGSAGVTLIELLVTLVILAILADAALPYAQMTVRRTREIELHHALREIRTAIDRFHEDWATGRIPHTSGIASRNGYPRTLAELVHGVRATGPRGGTIRYLRRIPPDPFADPRLPANRQWLLRGYDDSLSATTWDGKDVYDVHCTSNQRALNGARYRNW